MENTVGSRDRRTARPQVCDVIGEPHQFVNRTVKTVKSRDCLNACTLSFSPNTRHNERLVNCAVAAALSSEGVRGSGTTVQNAIGSHWENRLRNSEAVLPRISYDYQFVRFREILNKVISVLVPCCCLIKAKHITPHHMTWHECQYPVRQGHKKNSLQRISNCVSWFSIIFRENHIMQRYTIRTCHLILLG